jgi:uncharacterized protein YkwD
MRINGPQAEPRINDRLGTLLLVAVISIVAFVAPSPAAAQGSETFNASSVSTLVTLTNQSRASAGLPALKVDSTLGAVARWRSKDMIERNYFSHAIPGYGKVWDKLDAVGLCYDLAGENIGWINDPDDIATAAIHRMFMNSSGHRANVLGKTWDAIGIGAYKGPTGKKMWTVIFADMCDTMGSQPPPTPTPTARPNARASARRIATPRASAKRRTRSSRRPAERELANRPGGDAGKPNPESRPRRLGEWSESEDDPRAEFIGTYLDPEV